MLRGSSGLSAAQHGAQLQAGSRPDGPGSAAWGGIPWRRPLPVMQGREGRSVRLEGLAKGSRDVDDGVSVAVWSESKRFVVVVWRFGEVGGNRESKPP
jgi:hypothetical protein